MPWSEVTLSLFSGALGAVGAVFLQSAMEVERRERRVISFVRCDVAYVSEMLGKWLEMRGADESLDDAGPIIPALRAMQTLGSEMVHLPEGFIIDYLAIDEMMGQLRETSAKGTARIKQMRAQFEIYRGEKITKIRSDRVDLVGRIIHECEDSLREMDDRLAKGWRSQMMRRLSSPGVPVERLARESP